MKISDLNFTKRETEIFAFLANGFPRKVMADRLSISVHTLDNHLESLRRKTERETTQQLAVLAAKFFSH